MTFLRLGRILSPPCGINDTEQQRQARLLSVWLLLFTPFAALIVLYRWLTAYNPVTLLIGGAIIAWFLIAFLISRTRHFQIAGLATVTLVTVSCVLSIALNLNSQVPLMYISFSSLGDGSVFRVMLPVNHVYIDDGNNTASQRSDYSDRHALNRTDPAA